MTDYPNPYQSGTQQDTNSPPTVQSFPQASPFPPPQAGPFSPLEASPFPPPQAAPLAAAYGSGQYAGQPGPGLLLPDGVQLASTGRRIGAFFLAIPLAIITLGIGYAVWGLIAWRNGQTPALQVLGMRCWRPETQRVPGFWWMALREAVGRIAEELVGPVTLLVSFILMMTSQDRKSLHDLVAGTVVVHDPNRVLSR